jgi:hypothetical protein
VALPVIYDNVALDIGYRIDLLIENEIIVEIKAIERVVPVHKAQLLSYLRLSKKRVKSRVVAELQRASPARGNSSRRERSQPKTSFMTSVSSVFNLFYASMAT